MQSTAGGKDRRTADADRMLGTETAAAGIGCSTAKRTFYHRTDSTTAAILKIASNIRRRVIILRTRITILRIRVPCMIGSITYIIWTFSKCTHRSLWPRNEEELRTCAARRTSRLAAI